MANTFRDSRRTARGDVIAWANSLKEVSGSCLAGPSGTTPHGHGVAAGRSTSAVFPVVGLAGFVADNAASRRTQAAAASGCIANRRAAQRANRFGLRRAALESA